LQHSRYRNQHESMPVMTPCIHPFLYTIYEHEDSLAPLFAIIGEMDAYNAIATKMIAAKNTEHQFCFVVFTKKVKPLLSTTGFWNLLLAEKAVVNDFIENRHAFVSGPNAGGKSTAIRSLVQNIVLAQSFGVAAARQSVLTPFDRIHSFLNISDDLINGVSLLQSEINRAKEILQEIKAMPADQKYFFALDELFTGTASENGQECAVRFIENVTNYKNVQFVYATHFEELKKLGDKNKACANYKINAPTRAHDGALVYPYTLSPGASDVNVAVAMAENAGLFD